MSYLVIKCGGSVLQRLPDSFYHNIVTLTKNDHIQPVIVHGGGPMVSTLLANLNVKTTFVNGMRVTTDEVLDVVEMTLSGSVNKLLVRKILAQGGNAVGLSGVDGRMLEAKQLEQNPEIGYVGKVTNVNPAMLKTVINQQKIPVISPIAIDHTGQRLNINADLAAAAVAKALEAPLYMITNVPGVLKNTDVISELSVQEAKTMMDSGEINGGMIPKVQAAIDSLRKGVQKVAIINGLEEESLLKLITDGNTGTTFTLDEKKINSNLT
ncbi:acetylglutamate kinase [Virgibacillus doumboii]|uniref:acetylglutamate kinase n=1 Tax=Virgibacillus doumboii TaxID=2697503 RepID=UPI0013DE85BB|nr:acetylglutamate kinase [Virgibacillus doumboii]